MRGVFSNANESSLKPYERQKNELRANERTAEQAPGKLYSGLNLSKVWEQNCFRR